VVKWEPALATSTTGSGAPATSAEGFTFNEYYSLAAMHHYRFGLFSTIQLNDGGAAAYD